jgi:hypothetical protein
MNVFRQRQWEEPSAENDAYGATRAPSPDDASESADESSEEEDEEEEDEEEEEGSVRDASIADEPSCSSSSNNSTYDLADDDVPEPAQVTPRVSVLPPRICDSPGQPDATEAPAVAANRPQPNFGWHLVVFLSTASIPGAQGGLPVHAVGESEGRMRYDACQCAQPPAGEAVCQSALQVNPAEREPKAPKR